MVHVARKRGLVTIPHIRRVCDDEIERSLDVIEVRSSDERDAVGDAERPGVFARDHERFSGQIGRDDRRSRQLRGERHGKNPAAGADVRDPRRRDALDERDRLFDDELGSGRGTRTAGVMRN